MPLDLSHIRDQFPALSGEWIYFDNAGGTQAVQQVGERFTDYLYRTNVQLGASYEISQRSSQRVKDAQLAWSRWINATDPSEVIFGSSTTQLLQNLSKAFSMVFEPGNEVIVTNCDHEANIGPWRYLERFGIIIREWRINSDDLRLHMEDLLPLLSEKTRLVAFTHVSNILGTLNPVKELTSLIHRHGAMVCVDGVACAPHRIIDVQDLDVDFYVFSLYKVYGPHCSLLFGKRKHLEPLPGINHFFIGPEEVPYKLQPGHVNYELSYSLMGVLDYFREISCLNGPEDEKTDSRPDRVLFEQIAAHEEALSDVLLGFLGSQPGIRIIGESLADRHLRVPTISFVADRYNSDEIVTRVDPHRIGIRFGDFYARRLINDLGLSAKNGVVRVSMVHYNTMEEVKRLIAVLERILM